ncbi:MAG TPA: hypothetical protein PLO14_11745 [Accumulibacter sp.]|uniref:hypothetical protein n=1 Tax=Accumulibacter sp. TaxID=2053492 RepID=UPI0025E42DD9|nr:hypothetical protein [Accumulibacter sp.]MCM8597471.1 hypothetical protein [Accumulibacter sp.]MCM8661745.1 hypothetical protein [Accumulibacter sp.]HNC52893.1 hypothetical protein [Accumulibacter sp.]
MSLTPAEFERQLQPLLAGWKAERLADGWRLERAGRRVALSWRPLARLRLGVLDLPRLDVSISFTGGSVDQEADFIDDFLRHFRRGGG